MTEGAADAVAPGDLPAPAEVVDARGLLCPLPVIRLAAAARGRAPGTVMTVLVTDPAARIDVPAWARMRGHELVAVLDGESVLGGRPGSAAVTVRLGPS